MNKILKWTSYSNNRIEARLKGRRLTRVMPGGYQGSLLSRILKSQNKIKRQAICVGRISSRSWGLGKKTTTSMLIKAQAQVSDQSNQYWLGKRDGHLSQRIIDRIEQRQHLSHRYLPWGIIQRKPQRNMKSSLAW